jgi:hypothetical protein
LQKTEVLQKPRYCVAFGFDHITNFKQAGKVSMNYRAAKPRGISPFPSSI